MLGLPFEMDEPARRTVPWATLLLTGTVVLAGLVLLIDLPRWVDLLGFRPDDPWRHAGLAPVTAFFVHAGLLYLSGNAYALAFPGARIGWALRYWFVPLWWFNLPAWGAMLLWLLVQLLLAGQQAAGLTHVSASGHLGGAAARALFRAARRTMAA